MASLTNSINHLNNTNPSQTISKNGRRENISKLTLQGHYYSDTKPGKDTIRKENYRPIYLMKIDSQNPQLNTSKPNSGAHGKDLPMIYMIFIRIKRDLPLGCKEGSTYANQIPTE